MKITHKHLILLALLPIPSISLSATPVYEQNFEGGKPLVNTPDPDWSLTPIFDTLYGPGNTFSVTDSTAHSGLYSLKISYDGRNGFCNNCGTYGAIHKSGLDHADYFLSDTNENLTALDNINTVKINDGPLAKAGRLVFNKTNGFSKWEITAVGSQGAINNKLSVKLLKQGINGETPEFNGGDEIAIARQCGVDGHIANDINRRNDCDAAIIWFGDVSPQVAGTSIFRRMYLKAEITSPLIHQKLHYFRPGNDTDGNTGSIVLFADSQTAPHDVQPQLSGFGSPNNDVYPYRDYGGANFYKPGNGLSAGLEFKRSVWYYIEEQYKAATPSGATDTAGRPIYNADGEYRLWFAESGKEDTDGATPILELTNLTMPPIDNINTGPTVSFWGNIQHWTHLHGNWYMDDVVIATDTKIGKAPGGGKNIAPPNPPTATGAAQ